MLAKTFALAALVGSATAFAPVSNTARAVTSLNGLEDDIAGVIKGQLELDDDVDPTASFVEDLGADSLDAVELIMTLEEEFDIEIPEDDVVSITNIETAVKYITEKKGE